MNTQGKKVAVIGAGIGGLATAARLSHRGYEVDVFEKLPHCGGRANIIRRDGFSIDTGPSFVLMPDFFKEVFTDCGVDIKDYLTLQPLDLSYRIVYGDDSELPIYGDHERKKQAFERIEKGAGEGYERFMEELRQLYGVVEPLLYECFSFKKVLNPKYWSLLFKLKVLDTYWKMASKYFKDDRISYALTFQAMFIGVSPFRAPAFYSVITYADHAQKVFHPMGGMYQVPTALERLGREFDARHHYDSPVQNIVDEGGKVKIQINNETLEFDQVVINADYPYAKEKLLKRKIKKYEYSCSVYLMYVALDRKIEGLDHHCLFLCNDVKKNLDDIFLKGSVSVEPSFYTHVPTVTDPSLAPQGKDFVYILVPVPNFVKNTYNIADHEEQIRNYVFGRIKKRTAVDLRDITLFEEKFLPQDFDSRYNLKYSSTFGLAHSLFQSAFLRPTNFEEEKGNIFYTGASTQPGGGMPPVLASSKIVADLISRKAASK